MVFVGVKVGRNPPQYPLPRVRLVIAQRNHYSSSQVCRREYYVCLFHCSYPHDGLLVTWMLILLGVFSMPCFGGGHFGTEHFYVARIPSRRLPTGSIMAIV